MRAEQFSDLEQEAIVLLAVWDMFAGMVNDDFFENFKESTDASLMFSTANDRRPFNILLGDFLSQPNERDTNKSFFNLQQPANGARATDDTFLFYLRRICIAPR